MRETKMSKHSLLSQVGSLIYNFRQEKKEIKQHSNENFHKRNIQYPYPATSNKSYYSKNNK